MLPPPRTFTLVRVDRRFAMVGASVFLCSCALTQPSTAVESSEAETLSAASAPTEDITTTEISVSTTEPTDDQPILSVVIDENAQQPLADGQQPQADTQPPTTIPAIDGDDSDSQAGAEQLEPSQSSATTVTTPPEITAGKPAEPVPTSKPKDQEPARPDPTPTSDSTTTTGQSLNLLPPRLQRDLVNELNDRRDNLGLGPVEFSSDLADEAEQCALRSLRTRELAHCDHEVLWMGGIGTSADQLLDAWFNSELHLQALTYPTSTRAGGALVVDLNTGLAVAALRINY